MSSNPVIRFVLENKKVPMWASIVLHVISLNILYSYFLMSLSVFLLHPEWTDKAVQKTLPIIGYLAPFSFYATPNELSYIAGVIVMAWVWGTWIFGTRVKVTNGTLKRRAISFLVTWFSFCLIIILFSMRQILDIGYEKVVAYHYTIDVQYQAMMHIGALQMVGYLLMILPIGVMISFSSWLYGQYKEDKRIQEWFRTYKFESSWIGRFGESDVNELPDIQLARNAETNAPVILEGEARQTGTILIGPPGSGKTAIKIKTAFRTDLGHLQRTINAYPKYVKKFGYDTPEFQKAMAKHLIGSIIIEPAKDLCDDAYELALEHGIPEELIVYLDPSNKNTPGFNMMVGPTAEIVETITAVLEAVAETKDEFFKQAARAVLKHYVYLLKFVKGDNCTILDLDDLYQDPRKAMDLLEELESTIPSKEKIDSLDQDGRIHWIIVQKVVRWFRNEGLAIQTDRDGMVEKYPAGHEHAHKPKVTDLQFEFTRQTRNLLSDITKNPYLARILYAENGVNLTKLFTKGGILLVNTDLANLKNLSAIFGKLVLLCVHNAVFRRPGKEKTRSLVSFYADEFYDYMYAAFLQLTSQGRKFKFAPLVACQSLTQFGVKFGDRFTESMLGTIRNTIVYGGTSVYDTELLSKYLGTEIVEELQVRESYTPTYMDTPSFSISESIALKEKEIATSDDIMFQEFRYSYIRMVDEKSPKKAIRAVGDFVDPSNAKKWKKALDKRATELFLKYWREEDESNVVVMESDDEETPIDKLRKELASIDQAQDEIRNIEKEVSAEEVGKVNRFKPFTQEEGKPAPDRSKYFMASTNEEAAVTVEDAQSVQTEQPVKVDVRPVEPIKVEAAPSAPTPPPVVESPFHAPKVEEKVQQATMSFSAAFGTAGKEKINQVIAPKKEQPKQEQSFTNSFSTNNEDKNALPLAESDSIPIREEEAGQLKEVELDNNALSFFNDLKKNVHQDK
ncbi:TraM recognition domain-containing protein [Bacillaceae bacterium CLA-AA-H227]|uniref:TraM recognition domain-containing protein n=1 Tax=Robertmurraya yapensis (ex Hitch et al 2024) TaxID=3133160 RepID=A0ACC6SGI0_9BACI